MDLLQRGFASEYRAAVAANPSGKGIKIGRLYLPGTAPMINEAVDAALTKAGFQVVPLDDSFRAAWAQAAADANTIVAAWAWISDRQFTSNLQVSARTKSIIALGQFEYDSNYKNALARRSAWKAALARVLKHVDFIALRRCKICPRSRRFWEELPYLKLMYWASKILRRWILPAIRRWRSRFR